MNFPPGLFQATFDALRAQCQRRSETRGTMRYRLLGCATIIPCAARAARVPVAVGVCDLSASGIGIIHTHSMRISEQFILTIPASPEQQQRRAALFSVVFCHPLSLESHRIGAKFARELPMQITDDGCDDQQLDAAPASPMSRLPVPRMATAFQQQASVMMTAEEHEQVRALDERLAARRS